VALKERQRTTPGADLVPPLPPPSTVTGCTRPAHHDLELETLVQTVTGTSEHYFRGCLKSSYDPRLSRSFHDQEAAHEPAAPPLSTDLTDAEWRLLAPLIPGPKPGGRPPVHDRRELVNAMAYWLRAGCAWRLLPHDLPPWQRVYHYFRCWRQQGLWEQVHATLRTQERLRQG
jgi:transposase